MEHKNAASKLSELLGPGMPPVAVAFRATPPAGVGRVERAGPAGCAYWRLAAEGHVFYTDFTIPSAKLADVVLQLGTIVHANRALETYHEGRRQALGPPRG